MNERGEGMTNVGDMEYTPPAKPVITRSQATWLGDKRFDAGPSGRTHLIDASAKDGPGPVETLLNALLTCSAVDIIDILAKRRTPVERFSAEIVGHRRPEFPRRLMRVEIDIHIDGPGIEREHAERAVQLSFERYCSVAGSLGSDIVSQARLVLNGQPGEYTRLAIWAPERG
jgi:putative redox protein